MESSNPHYRSWVACWAVGIHSPNIMNLTCTTVCTPATVTDSEAVQLNR